MEGASNGQPIGTVSTHSEQPVPPPSVPSSSKRPGPAPPRRKKVKIEWIEDDAHRRSTFHKRKKMVLKKAEELQILCGVETCVVIYGDGDEGARRPEVWPSSEKAAELCRRFRSMPGHEATPRTMSHVAFTEDRIQKLRKQIARMGREVGDLCTRGLLYDGLLGKELHLEGAVKAALVKMIMDVSTEVHLELEARRRREAPAAAPSVGSPLMPPAWLGPAPQTPAAVSLLQQPAVAASPLLPLQGGLQGPLPSPGWANVCSPWELIAGGPFPSHYGEDTNERPGGDLGNYPLFNL
ncbi:hypothetical protein Taro_016746 [Colocasia esculenta]|uniref:MADS-box domain-containing protein n=1 Tax=Colocasia esculenta TaxID=4460 RepID=A0A843UR69_COLES|nr:hypothetical protein [Colocasia esculenta]